MGIMIDNSTRLFDAASSREVFTKDEVIVMLKELRFEIDEHSYLIHSYLVKDSDNNMVKGITMRDINQVILNKIRTLRGEEV